MQTGYTEIYDNGKLRSDVGGGWETKISFAMALYNIV